MEARSPIYSTVMAARPSAGSVYASQLYHPSNGLPNWRPERRIDIGDVGFMKEDVFVRLFNATLPSNHASQADGVPDNFEQLVLNRRHRDPRPGEEGHSYWGPGTTLCSNSVTKIEATVGVTASVIQFRRAQILRRD